MDARARQRLLQAAEGHFRSGDLVAAQAALESLVAQDPTSSRGFELLGYVHGNAGRLQEAHRCLEQACRLPNAAPEAHYYLGVALLRQAQDQPALEAFDRCIARAGPFFEALFQRGTAYSRLGRNTLALKDYLAALRLRPGVIELVFNIAKVYDAARDFTNALAYYDRALALAPGSADVLAHRGAVLYDLERYAEAVGSWEQALAADPKIEHLPGFLLHARLRLCDWQRWAVERDALLERFGRGEDVCGPFEMLAICGDEAVQLGAARRHVRGLEARVEVGEQGLAPPRPPTGRKIRVGYFSADFGRHAVSYLTAELFEQHDRESFETFAFATRPAAPGDALRARLAESFDEFLEVADESDARIVERARSLGLDIAVDLGGHTRGSRTSVFRDRVAPVQVNFLGYPGSMGASFIDYLIADATTVPGPNRLHYQERVVWLPECFQPSDTKRQVAPPPPSRKAAGLPEEGFVFCCFNNSYKLNPEVFAGWMRILAQVEGACLWLLADHGAVQLNLRREAERAGVDPARLVFGGRLPMDEYLGRYRQADLFLDTQPYNAGTTASDALYAGLPVLTRCGGAFAGRMAASLLLALGLPELVAASQDEYEATAVRLAREPAALGDLRARLARQRTSGHVFDMRRYARHLEAAYREMARRAASGEPPDHLEIGRAEEAPGT